MSNGRARAPGAWLVTGAASGLGAEMALRLVARGAQVRAWDRDALGLERLRRDLRGAELGKAGDPAAALLTDVVDVADEDAVRAGIERARAVGPIGHVFHSAGVLEVGSVEDTPASTYDGLMRVNYLGTVHVAVGALPALRDAGTSDAPATLTLVASVAGLRGFPELAAYSASKHAVLGFATALSDELDGTPIEVRTLCPPPADTPMLRRLERVPPVFALAPPMGADEVVDALLQALDRGDRRRVVLVDGRSRAWRGAQRMAPAAIDAWVRRAVRRATGSPPEG